MAKIVNQFPHHSNCDCCGRQASFKELARRPSGYGPLQPPIVHIKRPNTHHGTMIQPLEQQVSQRVGNTNQRRKSLQHGSESTQETSTQKTLDVLTTNLNAEEITMEIAEAIAERSILQASESRMKGTFRDKESLLEECMALKEALCDQLYHLQLHRVHHETIDGVQRKMEIAIQELEMAHGLQAPRTGDPFQLKARILGLKCRQQEYYDIMTIQQDDITILKKDTRVSFTKEASMERDIFAGETRRLQKMIRRLRVLYHKVSFENSEIMRLRESIAKLQIRINKIEMNIENSKSINEQMKKDIAQLKLDSIEAQKNAKNAIRKLGEFESHSLVLQNMLIREKDEANRIHKQTSTIHEKIQIVKKENVDRAVQASLAAQMLAPVVKKGKAGFKHGANKMGKLKEYKPQTDRDSTSATPTDLSAVRSSSPSSTTTPSSTQSTVNKDFDRIRATYMKAIGKATNTFVETAPGSGSPIAKPHPDLGSPNGDHFKYEQLQETFHKDVSDAENQFMDMMDGFEYGAARPRKDLEAEAKRLRQELETLQKQQMDLINKRLSNLTIELDNKTLKSDEYVVDVTDSKTSVKITSPDKSPEALARKKAEEEARMKGEAEEEARRAAEEKERRKRIVEEEAARRAAEEEAWKKREAEEAARRAAEDEARRKKMLEEDVARLAAEEEARKRRDAEDEVRRKKISEEDSARRAAEGEARKKREAEDEARRKKISEEDFARRAAEGEARKKREAEDKSRRAAEDEARRKKISEEDSARRAAEEEARKKRETVEEAARERKAVEEEEEAQRKKIAAEDEAAAARRKREAAEASAAAAAAATSGGKAQTVVVDASGDGDKKQEFFTEEMQGTIKENIMEVLSHLEVISSSVQQKASSSGSAAESITEAATNVAKKLEEPAPDQSK